MARYVRRGGELLVNTTTANIQGNPTISVLASGGFVVTWQDLSQQGTDASGYGIKAQVFDADGTALGPEFLVNTITSNQQTVPVVTALPAGGFVIAWQDNSSLGGDSSNPSIKAQIFDAAGARVGSEVLVNTVTIGGQAAPAITALASGGFLVTWNDNSLQSDPSGNAVKGQIFDAGGAKSGGEFLINTNTTNNQFDSTITALANGGFVVAWDDQSGVGGDASSDAIKVQVFGPAGAKLGGEILVNTTTLNAQSQPAIAALVGGGFVVSWTDGSFTNGDASGTSVRAQLFDANGSKVGTEFLVNTSTTSSQSASSITSLSDGGFVVTWQDFSLAGGEASGAGIKAQIFDGAGARVGGEFRVNTVTQNSQLVPTSARLADGFVIAWQDGSVQGLDTSLDGIKVQLYALGIEGDAGANALTGTETGNVFLLDQGGADFASGLGGKDAFYFGATFDDTDGVDGGTGIDQLVLQGNYTLALGSNATNGIEQIVLLSRTDATYVAAGAGSFNYNLTLGDAALGTGLTLTITGAGLSASETLTVDASGELDGAVQLFGGAGADTLIGGAGNDLLDGGAGSATLRGGNGDDRLVLSGIAINSAIDGGSGTDTLVVGGFATLASLAGIEAIELQSSASLTLTGAQFTAGVAPNAALGGTGFLTINMGPGDGELYLQQLVAAGGANVAITVTGSANDDVAKGALGSANTISGGNGFDSIRGGQQADTLSGGGGDDKLEGGQGADLLTGGAGADVFRYQSADAAGIGAAADRITDFVSGTDKLGFALLDSDPVTQGRQGFSYIDSQAFHATGAAEVRYGTSGADLLVQLDLNGDGVADMEIVLQGLGGGSLTSGDFLL